MNNDLLITKVRLESRRNEEGRVRPFPFQEPVFFYLSSGKTTLAFWYYWQKAGDREAM